MFTKEQILCIISALKIRKCNIEMEIMRYVDQTVGCTNSIKLGLLQEMIEKSRAELRAVESTLKSAEAALKCSDERSVNDAE